MPLSELERSQIADYEFKLCLSLDCRELIDLLLLRAEETNGFEFVSNAKKQELIELLSK